MKTVYGDLFDYAARTQGPIIIHGCNCHGAFAAGFAGLIRNKFPAAYKTYSDDCIKEYLKPGFVRYVPIHNNNNTIVANACTQLYAGRHAKLEYIDMCMQQIIQNMIAVSNIMGHKGADVWGRQIFIPAIGCGIGGLKLTDVKPVLEQLDELEQCGITTTLVLVG